MTTENPQAFSREAFICFPWGGGGGGGGTFRHVLLLLVKQNVKDIFIDSQRRKEQ